MAMHLALGATGLVDAGLGLIGCGSVHSVSNWRLGWVRFRRNASHLFDRSCDPAQRRAEVRQVDHGEEQADHPVQVVVREQRQQAQHGHDLKLELLRLVGHPLGQRVQVQIEVPDRENGDDQKNTDSDHQDIGITWRGDERRQVMGRAGMNRLAQKTLHSNARDCSADHLEHEAKFDPVKGANR